ncbi:MAG: hypothetical protein ABI608_06420 [Rhizomicrobium sp.]
MTTLFSLEVVKKKTGGPVSPESVEDRVMAALRELLPVEACAFRGNDGAPDIVICYRGKMLGLELKGRTESFSEAQAVAFPKLRDAGMRIEVARDRDQALNRLREMGVPLKEEARHAVRDVLREETRRRK